MPNHSTRVGLIVLAACAAYQFAYWNRYLAPTGGYELMFAGEYARGKLPYRDYYFPVQPGWVIASVAGVELFGRHVIGFWAAGVFVRLAGVWAAYRLAGRLAPPAWAGWVTVVGFAVSCGDVADFPPWYNYLCAAFAALAAHAVVLAVEADCSRRRLLWAVAAGFWLAVGLLNKQTTGVLVAAAAAVVLGLAAGWRVGPRRAAAATALMLAIAALPCALAAWWLVREGVWADYVDQVYVRGPSAKGGLGGAVARVWWGMTQDPWESSAFVAAGWAAAVLGWVRLAPPNDGRTAAIRAVLGTVAGLAVLFAGSRAGYWAVVPYSWLLAGSAFGFLGPLGLAVGALVAGVRGKRDGFTLAAGVSGGIAFASAFALSLSWPVFPPMAWPGLGVCLAAFVGTGPPTAAGRWVKVLVAVGGAGLIAASGYRKVTEPNEWGLWREPPLTTPAVTPALPELAGFRISPRTADFYDGLVAVVREHAGPGEPILVFPNMPLVYGLADRPVATFSYMHWHDVCPDYVAEEDAARVKANPPKVIVWLDLPDSTWDDLEDYFRGGRRSGQRVLIATVAELAKTRYAEAAAFPVQTLPDGTGVVVRVWVRK